MGGHVGVYVKAYEVVLHGHWYCVVLHRTSQVMRLLSTGGADGHDNFQLATLALSMVMMMHRAIYRQAMMMMMTMMMH